MATGFFPPSYHGHRTAAGRWCQHKRLPLVFPMPCYIHVCSAQFTNFSLQFQKCSAQIRNIALRKLEIALIANQFQNCTATLVYFWNGTGTHHQPVFFFWLEGNAHPLGQGENKWWTETHAFSPWTWTVSYGVDLEWSQDLLSVIFRDCSAHVGWDSDLCRTFQNAIADKRCCCLQKMLSLISDTAASCSSLLRLYQNCVAQFWNRIAQFWNCLAQFRIGFPFQNWLATT